MDKIISKRYYKITFKIDSALSVGNGRNDNTDRDIIKDCSGRPYIPGTSLAGVYRSLLENETADKYLGFVTINTGKAESSRLVTYDATMTSDKYRIGKRDCVSLDEWKTSIAGAKFDFEVLEPGAEFVTYVEQNKYAGDENIGDAIAEAWAKKLVSFGSKAQRGLGQVTDAQIFIKEFSFENSESVDKWLDFDMYDYEAWNDAKNYAAIKEPYIKGLKPQGTVITLKLKQRSPITVRMYTTEVSTDVMAPDYKQMTYLRSVGDKQVEIPVIPGTTWAGAFRHRMLELGGEELRRFFGEKGRQVGKTNTGHKSYIRFLESEIEGAKAKKFTRNSIDRFSGGAVDTALFAERMYLDGKTSLEIVLEEYSEPLMKALAAAITDLHMGFMSIGGETSIGHGIFEVSEVWCDGAKIEFNGGSELYKQLTDKLIKKEAR